MFLDWLGHVVEKKLEEKVEWRNMYGRYFQKLFCLFYGRNRFYGTDVVSDCSSVV